MKQTLFYFLLFLGLYLPAHSQVIISGSVSNAPKSASLVISCYNNPLEWKELQPATTQVNDQGLFQLQFPLKNATKAKLLINDQYTDVFLVPGDSLFLKVDFEHFDETIEYAGKGAADNNYLANEAREDYQTLAVMSKTYEHFDSFKNYIDSIEQLNLTFYNKQNNADFSTAFLKQIKTTLKYRYINAWFYYPTKYDAQKKEFVKRIVPDTFYNFLKRINLNEEAFDNSDYLIAIEHYLYVTFDSKLSIADSLPDLKKREIRIQKNVDFIKKTLKGEVLNYQLSNYLKRQLGFVADDSVYSTQLMKNYHATCTNKEYVAIIYKFYENAARLKKGNPAPFFKLKDIDGKLFSLTDFRYHVLLIDFWATWCAPCKASMPATHQLYDTFKDRKDFVLLSINMSDNELMWHNFLKKENLPGIHLFADEKESDALYNNFNFDGIPHFVLIDKNGKLIDANADNTEKTKEKIKLVLETK